VTRLLRLDGRNATARISAVVRLAMLPLLFVFEGLETPASPHDLPIGEPVLVVLVLYAVAATAVAFAARHDLPPAPFAVIDVALVSLLVYAEGGALAEVRFVLFVPVLVAVLSGPRLTLLSGRSPSPGSSPRRSRARRSARTPMPGSSWSTASTSSGGPPSPWPSRSSSRAARSATAGWPKAAARS
jgi:hypothetical protein